MQSMPLLEGDVIRHLIHHFAESLTLNLIHHSVQNLHQTSKLQTEHMTNDERCHSDRCCYCVSNLTTL